MLSQTSQYSPKFVSIPSSETPVHGVVPNGQQRTSSSRDGIVPLIAGIVIMSAAGNVCGISEYLPKQQANTSNKYGYFQYKVVQNQIVVLKAQLNFNNSDLARIVGVTRQSVHDWLNDHQISEGNQKKLDTLRNIAAHLQKQRVEITARTFLREFGPERLSLSSVIQSGKNSESIVETIIKNAELENRSRERLNRTLSSRDARSRDMKELLTSSLLES